MFVFDNFCEHLKIDEDQSTSRPKPKSIVVRNKIKRPEKWSVTQWLWSIVLGVNGCKKSK